MLSLSEKIDAVKIEFDDISYSLDERRIRLWCAAKAKAYNRVYGKGGVTVVHKATDVSRPTIYAGLKEIESEKRLDKRCIRNVGGGRKKITEIYPDLSKDLENLLEPLTRGDPESPLRWTCRSTYNLCDELLSQGYEISQRTICDLLSDMGYSLQSNRKTQEGGEHEDRNAQFEYITNCSKIVWI